MRTRAVLYKTLYDLELLKSETHAMSVLYMHGETGKNGEKESP
jgi:hypothetical protein